MKGFSIKKKKKKKKRIIGIYFLIRISSFSDKDIRKCVTIMCSGNKIKLIKEKLLKGENE